MTMIENLRAHHWNVTVGCASMPLGEVLRRMRHLSPPEQDVVSLLIGLDGVERTLADTARELGMTPRQARAIRDKGFSKLRHPSTTA